MNKHFTFIALSTLATTLAAGAALAVPTVDNIGVPANSVCKPKVSSTGVNELTQPVLHFDKIIFMVTQKLQAANPETQPLLEKIPLNTELDIKVKDDPRTVSNLKGKVLSFLGAVNNPQFYPTIKIIDVDYAVIVCPK